MSTLAEPVRATPLPLESALVAEVARIQAEISRPSGSADPFAESVRATHMPMIVTDARLPDNPVVFANDAFCRLTGYTRDEILGRNCRFLQGPETSPATIARIRAAVAAGERIEIDIRNHRKTGEPFWNRLLTLPVRDAAGDIAYFVASQVDVTLERERLTGLENKNAALVAELADRLRAQEDSEARLRFATKAGRLGIWELDLPTGVVSASAICRENFGLPAGNNSMAALVRAVHPDDRDRVAEAYQHAIETGADFAVEYAVVRSDGAIGWVDVRAQVERGANGDPRRIAGTSLDITVRRQAEARLELSEAHLRLATEAAEVGTWDWNLETDVLTWSDRTKAMFGFPPDAQCSMADFYAGLHPDDLAQTGLAFAAAIDPQRRATYDVEYRTIGAQDGVVRWVAARGRALFDDGRCVRAMGTAIDITKRKAAAARGAVLLDLTGTLRLLTDPRIVMEQAATALGRHLSAHRVGFARLSEDGRSATLETGFAEGLPPLSGTYAVDQVSGAGIGRWIGRLIIVEDTAAGAAIAGIDHLGIGVGALVSVPLIRGSRIRACLFVASRLPRLWQPEEVALIEDVASLVWDAVERARAEEALRDLNATLEARVEERTAALLQAEDALRQAQKMEAVGQLTGGIAHDFNNLLTGIVGSLELLQRRVAEGRTADLQRYADGAVSSANRAAALTKRLLAFARRQPLDPREIDVNALVSGMAELLERTLGPRVRLDMALAGALWPVLCDPNQLESALLNLAINARDAMTDDNPADVLTDRSAGGIVTIETGNATLDLAFVRAHGGELAPGDYVKLCVADTGKGMTQDVMNRVFEPFFTTKPLGQGTGLGLSMLYGFIRQSHGHIQVASEPGHGTRFHIYLPRAV